MEKEDFLSDELMKDLFRNQNWDSPGDDFTENVIEQILKAPAIVPVKKPFFLMLKSSWPFIVLFLVTVIFLMTSDLPYTDYIPGKEYFIKTLIPSFTSLFSGVKPFVVNSKVISIPLMVLLAGSLLIGFDYFLFNKRGVRQQPSN
jgi:hypothetical protein